MGARVGNWYLEQEVYQGPQGSLYRARSYREEGRVAAVKIFHGPNVREEQLAQKLAAEMLPLQRLEHANLARYYDSGISNGTVYVACEWIDGEDYAQRLRQGPVPWPEVLQVAVQAARALKHAHNRNVLHRELKPAHLMRQPDGTVKLLSCGLARIFPPTPPLKPTPLGAEAFLPPELANGKPYTRRSDFYALGGVLYALLTGRPPFTAATLVELTHKHCYALPERPALLVPDLPAEIDEFICLLLEKNPSRRPGHALQLLEELERIRARLERQGQRIDWPARLTPDTVETVALSEQHRDESASVHSPRPLMQRPWVVIPAFLLVVGLLLYAFVRPQAPAEQLYEAALPLMQSDRPEDWEQAWQDYLEPLSRRYPDRYREEIAAFRHKLQEYRELKRAILQGSQWQPRSEAERAYWRGLRKVQVGEIAEARRIWSALLVVFEAQESERTWLDLARLGLTLLERQAATTSTGPGAASTTAVPPQLHPVVERVHQLRQNNRAAEAEAIRRGLEELYRHDPAVLDFLHQHLTQ